MATVRLDERRIPALKALKTAYDKSAAQNCPATGALSGERQN